MIEKCPNPNCKDGWIGELDNGIPGSLPVVCCICEGKGEMDVIEKVKIKGNIPDVRKPKIYVFPSHANPRGDCAYIAVAQDGEEIAGHISSSEDYGRSDMGVTWPDAPKHKEYRKKYPDGYELEYVPDWKAHPFLSKQAEANKNAGVGQTELDSQ